jgi:DNA-directed RNA polymerase subunit M/transcription elongation factor TFIIS
MGDKLRDAYRKSELKAIYANLKSYKPLTQISKRSLTRIARKIEIGIHNYAIEKANERNVAAYWENEKFVEQYSSIGYLVKMNLDTNSSVNAGQLPEIRDFTAARIYNYYLKKMLQAAGMCKIALNGVFVSSEKAESRDIRIAYFNPVKLARYGSNDMNALINKSYVDQLRIRGQQNIEKKYSRMYKCSACGENKTEVYELQTCSGDEGGTLFVNCVNCGKRWTSY